MSKAEYRSAVRSRQLINAALADLLQEKALEKITVTDIVRRAGINRGTFYRQHLFHAARKGIRVAAARGFGVSQRLVSVHSDGTGEGYGFLSKGHQLQRLSDDAKKPAGYDPGISAPV